jgi:hypothetical protein
MSTFVPVAKPEPVAYTFAYTQYVSVGAPAAEDEAAEGCTCSVSVVAVSLTYSGFMLSESSTVFVPIS